MYPVIFCIAKKEHDYIEEFVKYHLALGFQKIFIYDNEDTPTYASLLENYKDSIVVLHLPGNNYAAPVQYIAMSDFKVNHCKSPITHVAHIDIDEFICLKKHSCIQDFIKEYIKDDCVGIGMNWKFFGSSGHTKKTNIPVTIRFTKCQNGLNQHIKTLCRADAYAHFHGPHHVQLHFGHIKSTNGAIINGPFNHAYDDSVIQINHYKCKTLEEYKYIRTRQRADTKAPHPLTAEQEFPAYDANDTEDLTAHNFYTKVLEKDVQI